MMLHLKYSLVSEKTIFLCLYNTNEFIFLKEAISIIKVRNNLSQNFKKRKKKHNAHHVLGKSIFRHDAHYVLGKSIF